MSGIASVHMLTKAIPDNPILWDYNYDYSYYNSNTDSDLTSAVGEAIVSRAAVWAGTSNNVWTTATLSTELITVETDWAVRTAVAA